MKIAFLSFYSGHIYRGAETFVYELANRLVKLGHNVIVYQNGDSLSNSLYRTISLKIPVDWKKKGNYTPFVNYYGRIVGKFTRKVLSIIDEDTDLVFPTNGQWQSVLCSLWAKTRGKKIVISGQSGRGLDDRINLWTFPDAFVSLTRHQEKWAKRANPFVRLANIPNGVDIEKFHPEVIPILLELERPIILCVAAFDSWKRQDLAIKAVARFEKGSLLLIGKGESEERLRAQGMRLLGERFKILSFPYEMMPSVYPAADIFTYPTVPWESFGIVMVEALASNLPVVANDDLIRREIVGDAGIFIDPTDTDAYSKALDRALKTNWADMPRKQAEKFDWDKIAENYEKLFLELVK